MCRHQIRIPHRVEPNPEVRAVADVGELPQTARLDQNIKIIIKLEDHLAVEHLGVEVVVGDVASLSEAKFYEDMHMIDSIAWS